MYTYYANVLQVLFVDGFEIAPMRVYILMSHILYSDLLMYVYMRTHMNVMPSADAQR